MTQQVPSPSSKLRKGFLIVGIVLLIMGFFFFYLAGRIDYVYVTKYQDTVNMSSYVGSYPYDFGTYPQNPIKPYLITMEPSDYVMISYEHVPTNGTVYLVLWDHMGIVVLRYSNLGFLDFRNERTSEMIVEGWVVTGNSQNLVSITTTLNHYERPQWVSFGIGVVLSSLAVIPIFKSRK